MKTVAEETNPVSHRILRRFIPNGSLHNRKSEVKLPENVSNDAIFRKQLNRSIAFQFQNEVIVQLVFAMSDGVRCSVHNGNFMTLISLGFKLRREFLKHHIFISFCSISIHRFPTQLGHLSVALLFVFIKPFEALGMIIDNKSSENKELRRGAKKEIKKIIIRTTSSNMERRKISAHYSSRTIFGCSFL